MTQPDHIVPEYRPTVPEWLQVVRLGVVEPVAPAFGEAPLRAPSALDEALFAPLPPDAADDAAWAGGAMPDCATYALLDAASLSLLPELLEASGLEYKCLFTGEALEKYGDSAPWLVRLDAGNAFTRKLMMPEEEGGYWELQLGIFLRARCSFEALWKHLRKFTRVQDHTGAWFFNRFWALPVSTALMELGNADDLAPFISPLFPSGQGALRMITITQGRAAMLWRIPPTQPPRARPVLTPEVEIWMRHIRKIQQFEEIICVAHRHADADTPMPFEDAAAHLRTYRDAFFRIGFWRKDHLAMLCVWELLLGPDFIDRYEGGKIRDILMTSDADWVAIKRIRNHLDPPEEMSEDQVLQELAAEQQARRSESKP